mmetsp:Transcript_17286/g.45068  ORF Transcript_17286/g.45068 Transcript_17286/m.45068 type:complete len:185 (+) Transcript_17286:62-616(+)
MANKGQAYGMSAEVAGRIAAKHNPELEAQAISWLETLTGKGLVGDLSDWLHDGVILCEALNALNPGSVKKVNASKMAFKQMENISNFLAGASSYGMLPTDLFQTVDLYEAKNMVQVIDTIHALGRVAQKNGFKGPVIGAKMSEKNERNFSPEQLKAGDGIVGLQAGFTKGANQSGMNFGNTRHL